MSQACQELHRYFSSLPRYHFPFEKSSIPRNGIYILFEKGETAHGTDRVVRIGTHTGEGQLLSRLQQHFVMENKDRSIFRKNIGRALLRQHKDPYAAMWEIDFTTRASRETYGSQRNVTKEKQLETEITDYLRSHMSFVVIEAEDRLKTEAKIIATIAQCEECKPSQQWLGTYSPKEKICNSGLWLVNELGSEPFTPSELQTFLTP
jgi:hypothetical protein